jgi:hypothetical protein
MNTQTNAASTKRMNVVQISWPNPMSARTIMSPSFVFLESH